MLKVITLALAALALATPSLAFDTFQEQAQSQQAPIKCYPPGAALGGLLSRFGEVPIFGGHVQGQVAALTITLNTSTGTWSGVARGTGSSCIVIHSWGGQISKTTERPLQ